MTIIYIFVIILHRSNYFDKYLCISLHFLFLRCVVRHQWPWYIRNVYLNDRSIY